MMVYSNRNKPPSGIMTTQSRALVIRETLSEKDLIMPTTPHPLTVPLDTILTTLEAVLDDQASVGIPLGATPAARTERARILAVEIEGNAGIIDEALSPALTALSGINDLLLAVHGEPNSEMPAAIRPLSWLYEMIKDCKARGPAPDCEDTNAFWTMVSEVEAMHAAAAAALKKLSANTGASAI